MYEFPISHEKLHAYRVVKGSTPEEAAYKAQLQRTKWEEQWQRVVKRTERQENKGEIAARKGQAKTLATEQNDEAEQLVQSMETILLDGVKAARPVNWANLKQTLRYSVLAPIAAALAQVPEEPTRRVVKVELPFLLGLLPSVKAKRTAEAEAREAQRYKDDHAEWKRKKSEVETNNKKFLAEHEAALKKYEADKQSYIEQATEQNAAIDRQQESYVRKEPEAVVNYCQLVLESSSYPDTFPSSCGVDYIPETRILVVEYALPDVDALPAVKGYKYVAAKDEIQAIPVSDAWRNKTYDSVLYQITLRTLHELFHTDEADALDAIVFNGWVNSIDKATGKEANACIVSVQATKAEMQEFSMGQVEPRACFKKLKGVSASRLINLSPIRPILQLNREDHRFVPSHNVVDGLDESANLAAMDWEEFEHLIRELFEKEFSTNGSEVKITQASRDGGVDAVAFDPDPIRGGKIVIQAKRYTNTVSVSAVRDLYGTILNEGANKGILVSTADYGPDAYEFAKEKPITLLNGNELLFLLQKHGHKARINLAEARLLAAEQSRAASRG